MSFIAAEKANYPLSLMCRVLEVNRTSLHDWERRPPSDRALYDAFLLEKIKAIHAASTAPTAPQGSTPSSGSSTASPSAASALSG